MKPIQVDAQFVEAHSGWMLRLANKILHDPQLAQDAVQEAFLAVHTKADSFANRSSVRTWLYRITLNAALGMRRRDMAASRSVDELGASFDAGASRFEPAWEDMRTVEQTLESAELTAFVRQSVESLPEAYRLCLQLRDFEQLSVGEVAEILDISEANVKVRTHRARAALKQILDPLLRGRPSLEILAGHHPVKQAAPRRQWLKGLMLKHLPMMISCEEFDSFIADYLDGTLAPEQRRVFELHIRTCKECREYLAAYQRARDIAYASVSAPSDVPADLVSAVVAALKSR